MSEYKYWCGNCQIRIYVQRHNGKILTWQDCPYTCEYGTAMRCSTKVKEEPMTDSIDRQAAINAVHKNYDTILDFKSDGRTVADSFEDIINDLPSAQPERKKGKWETYIISMFDGEGCRCSECGFEGAPYWDFCPNCGADMREVE